MGLRLSATLVRLKDKNGKAVYSVALPLFKGGKVKYIPLGTLYLDGATLIDWEKVGLVKILQTKPKVIYRNREFKDIKELYNFLKDLEEKGHFKFNRRIKTLSTLQSIIDSLFKTKTKTTRKTKTKTTSITKKDDKTKEAIITTATATAITGSIIAHNYMTNPQSSTTFFGLSPHLIVLLMILGLFGFGVLLVFLKRRKRRVIVIG